MGQNQANQTSPIDEKCKEEKTEETEGNANPTPDTGSISAEEECNKESHTAPRLEGDGYEEPSYPDQDNKSYYTGELPLHEYAAIIAKYNASLSAADKAYDESIMVAETAYETAKGIYANAGTKADRAVTLLQKPEITDEHGQVVEVGGTIVVAKQQSWADYRKCLHDALPKNCRNVEVEVPEEQEAVCAAKLKKGLADQNLQYETEIQTICQEKADAQRAWIKAQEQYRAAERIADATKTVARQTAEVDKYTELATAYAACKV